MIVCHCHGITEREIRESVRAGARTCGEVAEACDAGGGCGGCRPLVAELVEEERTRACSRRGRLLVLPADGPSALGAGCEA